MADRSTALSLALTCQTCEGRKLLQRTEIRKRWFVSWKVQRFWLCRSCDGTGQTRNHNSSVIDDEEVNMAGKHRKASASKKKECKWCRGTGEFHSGAISIRCGRCNGSGEQ
jgi:DnaJ-class molecular chaperone